MAKHPHPLVLSVGSDGRGSKDEKMTTRYQYLMESSYKRVLAIMDSFSNHRCASSGRACIGRHIAPDLAAAFCPEIERHRQVTFRSLHIGCVLCVGPLIQ